MNFFLCAQAALSSSNLDVHMVGVRHCLGLIIAAKRVSLRVSSWRRSSVEIQLGDGMAAVCSKYDNPQIRTGIRLIGASQLRGGDIHGNSRRYGAPHVSEGHTAQAADRHRPKWGGTCPSDHGLRFAKRSCRMVHMQFDVCWSGRRASLSGCV